MTQGMIPKHLLEADTMTPIWLPNFCLMVLKHVLSGAEEFLERLPRLSLIGVNEFLQWCQRTSSVVPRSPWKSVAFHGVQ